MNQHKPKIGLLGISQELYLGMVPGIPERLQDFANQLISTLADQVQIDFPKVVMNEKDAQEVISHFNQQGYDGMLEINLTFGPSLNLVRGLQKHHTPILLANVQPEYEVTPQWNMNDLTYNQGIHGIQDTANCLLRLGKKFMVITEDWRSQEFKDYVTDWAKAANAYQALRQMKIAYFGKMNGMGDTITDWHAFMQVIGPEIREEPIGQVCRYMEALTPEEVQGQIKKDSQNFQIDKNMPAESHQHAVEIMLGFEKLLQQGGYAGYSANFDVFQGDGRFRQIGLLAASNLMAKGYGYGAEGDINSCTLVAAGHQLHGNAHFTEMYAMDFKRDSMLMSHMGEGNWKIARKDKPVRLAYRELGIGGLDNPPTTVFMAEPGPATITSLVPLGGNRFRLVVMQGHVLDHEEYPTIEMPYFHFKPDRGVRAANTGWLKAGGTHHQCLLQGDQRRRWQMLAEMLNIELIEV